MEWRDDILEQWSPVVKCPVVSKALIMSEFNSNDTTGVVPHAPEAMAPDAGSIRNDAVADEVALDAPLEKNFSEIFSEFQRTEGRRTGEDGRQIRGTVVAVNSESVFIDIGFKSEGMLQQTAFPANGEPVKAGDTLMVSVKGRDADGYYQLSLFRTAQPKDWTSLEKAFAEKSTIAGNVTGVVKGGLHIDVGVRAFLPASRSGARDAAEMEKLVGQEIRCRITKLDVAEEDVVVDRRVVAEEEALEEKGQRFAEMHEGAVVNGTVRSLTDYGAFVDLGGIDGLLHVSDIAWSRISHASDVLEVGQQVEVKVLKIDPESQRISLGLKQLLPHPWDAVPEKFSIGDRVRGTVTRIAEFGAFVEIAPGVEGLVHLSEMSWSKRIHKATEVMNVADTVDAVILGINIEERRISLGLKQTLGDPWVEAAQRITAGSVVEGPVASITKFGAFVQVAEGVQGLVHISEITGDRRLNHPSDLLRVGEVIRAQVLEIDKEKRQLRLSMKQLVPTGLDEFLAEHVEGDTVTGRVVSMDRGVAQIELGEAIVALCALPNEVNVLETLAAEPPPSGPVDLSAFSSMLNSKWKSGSPPSGLTAKPEPKKREPVNVGQVRNFCIGRIDLSEKRIELELAE
jgi:small subunit ribosomal protein S1